MSDERQPDSAHEALTPGAPSQMDRRGFFRGAAALTVGGFAAPGRARTDDRSVEPGRQGAAGRGRQS